MIDSRDPDPLQSALDQALRSADIAHADAAKLHREAADRLEQQSEHELAVEHRRAAEVHEAAARRRTD
jgi:hypothetical protein